MGSGATAKYALPYPLDTDAPNIPGDVEDLAAAVDAILAPWAQDIAANRPAVGKTGRTFTQTDGLAGTTWRDSGAEWRALGSRVQANAAGDVGQIVRAAAGQTADILHVEDPAGNPYFKVGSNGATSITPGAGSSSAQALLAQAGVAGQRALVAKMAAGQTANAIEVQDATSAVKASIDPTGKLSAATAAITGAITAGAATLTSATVNGLIAGVTFGIGTGWVSGTQASIGSATPGVIPLLIEGATGGTADLLQVWASTAGPTVMRVGPAGSLTVTPSSATTATAATLTQAGTASQLALIAKAAAGQTQDIFHVRNNADGWLGGWSAAGLLTANVGFKASNAGNGTVNAELVTNEGGNTNTVIQVIKATSGQIGNMTEWRDGANVLSSAVDGSGNFYTTKKHLIGVGDMGAKVNIDTGAINVVGIIVRAASGQTSNAQEWKDAGNVVKASVGPTGALWSATSVTAGAGIYNSSAESLIIGYGGTTQRMRITDDGTWAYIQTDHELIFTGAYSSTQRKRIRAADRASGNNYNPGISTDWSWPTYLDSGEDSYWRIDDGFGQWVGRVLTNAAAPYSDPLTVYMPFNIGGSYAVDRNSYRNGRVVGRFVYYRNDGAATYEGHLVRVGNQPNQVMAIVGNGLLTLQPGQYDRLHIWIHAALAT